LEKDVKAYKLYYERRHISPDADLPNKINYNITLINMQPSNRKTNQALIKFNVKIESHAQ